MNSYFKDLRYFMTIFLFRNILNMAVVEFRACIKEITFNSYIRGIYIQYGPKKYYFPPPEEVIRKN